MLDGFDEIMSVALSTRIRISTLSATSNPGISTFPRRRNIQPPQCFPNCTGKQRVANRMPGHDTVQPILHARNIIANEAKQSIARQGKWIASSLALLAMTAVVGIATAALQRIGWVARSYTHICCTVMDFAKPFSSLALPAAMAQTVSRIGCANRIQRPGVRYNGKLSCFFAGISTFLSFSIASARAIRLRVECGMMTSSM